MSNDLDWNEELYNKFVPELEKEEKNEVLLSELKKVLETRLKGWKRTKQAQEFGMSMATLDRRIKRLRVLYDRVRRKHPELNLPKRRMSKQEKWMDTH